MPDLVGTWRLVGVVAHDLEGRPLPLPYGPQAIGRIVFTADQRMMAALSDGRADLPTGTKREYGGYCGDYTFDGTTLATNVDVAPNPALLAPSRPAACASRATGWSCGRHRARSTASSTIAN